MRTPWWILRVGDDNRGRGFGSRGNFLREEGSKFKVEKLKGKKLNAEALRTQRRECRAVGS
jgi:hypothetical protein